MTSKNEAWEEDSSSLGQFELLGGIVVLSPFLCLGLTIASGVLVDCVNKLGASSCMHVISNAFLGEFIK